MKKAKTRDHRKLKLSREAIRPLSNAEAKVVVGGSGMTICYCETASRCHC